MGALAVRGRARRRRGDAGAYQEGAACGVVSAAPALDRAPGSRYRRREREDGMTNCSTRREFLGAAASASAFLIAGANVAHAQYPERGLSLIVPYGAGGGTDVTARLPAKGR